MGSKNIKAMAFHGNAEKEIAEPSILEELWQDLKSQSKDHPIMTRFRNNGTPVLVDVINGLGALPTRYWSKGSMDNVENITAEALHSRCKVRPRACAKCPIACGRMTTVLKGRHKGLKIEGPEFETIYAFGSLCEIDSIEEIAYLNDLCDRLGMDTISAGNLAAFTIEASHRGLIDEKYEYGDADAVATLVKDMATRRGLGAILADGIRYAAKQWNMEDVAIHVKGLEPAAYDPRSLKSMGLAYGTSDRGACHIRSTAFKCELSGMVEQGKIEGIAQGTIGFEDRLTLQDALVLCRFYGDIYMWEGLQKIIEGTTGMKLDQVQLQGIASNIRDAAQRFNRREGMTRADDMLPARMLKEPLESGQRITAGEMERMLSEYYQVRGWDETGLPPDGIKNTIL
jgi:aldehyde:ferredoxin oxidoreductase